MTEPVIVDRKPMAVTLKPGNYAWCQCGKSANQPFCDGAHAGTGIQPVRFSVENETVMKLCMCKHTKHPPKCDGSHNSLP